MSVSPLDKCRKLTPRYYSSKKDLMLRSANHPTEWNSAQIVGQPEFEQPVARRLDPPAGHEHARVIPAIGEIRSPTRTRTFLGVVLFAGEVQHCIAGNRRLGRDRRRSALENRQVAVLKELRGDRVDNQADLVQVLLPRGQIGLEHIVRSVRRRLANLGWIGADREPCIQDRGRWPSGPSGRR